MDQITDVEVKPLQNSPYVKPLTIHYKQTGVAKTWDLIQVHDSIAVIIFNTSRNVLVFVRQFRPAPYFNGIPENERKDRIDTDKYPGTRGLMLETCAGIVDKSKSLQEIAQEEVLEECGYDVQAENIKPIISYRSSVGVCGQEETLFYVEVTDAMRVTAGGGNPEEGELIEVVEMTLPEVRKYLASGRVNSSGGFMFAVQWFLTNHKSG